MLSPNWPVVSQETVRHLQALLRLDTTNPPGNEMVAAEYLAGVLRTEGLEPMVLESAPRRGNVIARLTGTGEAPPLLLYGHTDVVPAEAEHWTHPPFSGEIADGYVWGRGAIDMKDTVAQQLMVFLLLKREGVRLKRDVIYAATADEEIGGEDGFGVSWLARHHPDLLQAEFALTEGGGQTSELGGKRLYPIKVAEKGTAWFKLRARGKPGHASAPHPDNAVVHLVRVVDRLAAQGLPYHLCEATAGFLSATAEAIGGPFGETLRQLQSPAAAEHLLNNSLKHHPLWPILYAMLHNTATPTLLNAGVKTNVIPSVAEATIDGRTLPGFTWEDYLAEVRAVIGEGYECEPTIVSPPIETSIDTPLYRLITETLKQHDPEGQAVPIMLTGATDAKYLDPLGVPTYGFAPLKLAADFPFNELLHAHDERVPVEGLGWGVQVLYEVVKEYCTR